jgi:hypothetical protein
MALAPVRNAFAPLEDSATETNGNRVNASVHSKRPSLIFVPVFQAEIAVPVAS